MRSAAAIAQNPQCRQSAWRDTKVLRRSAWPLGIMKIIAAAPSDLDEGVGCLAKAFVHDPITGFLLQTGPGYHERVTQRSCISTRRAQRNR